MECNNLKKNLIASFNKKLPYFIKVLFGKPKIKELLKKKNTISKIKAYLTLLEEINILKGYLRFDSRVCLKEFISSGVLNDSYISDTILEVYLKETFFDCYMQFNLDLQKLQSEYDDN